MTDEITVIEIYCSGAPDSPHERRPIARMIRALGTGGARTWAVTMVVAYKNGRPRVQRDPADDWEHDRFALRCQCSPTESICSPVVMDETLPSAGRERLMQELDACANRGQSELRLYALAGIVSQ